MLPTQARASHTGPHASANPTIPQQIVYLHEGLSLQVTQDGVECMDELTQKGNSAGGCDMVLLD